MVRRKAVLTAGCIALACFSAYGQVKSRVTIPRGSISPSVLAQPVTPQAPPTVVSNAQIPPMTLKAVTATANGKTEVRLRWLANEGWVPDGKGFNVYKIVGGKRTGPLNPAPIAADERKLQPAAPTSRISTSRTMKMAPVAAAQAAAPATTLLDVLHTARTSMPGVDRKQLFSFDRHVPITSAAPAFAQLKTRITQFSNAKQLGLPMSHVLQSALDAPEVKAYSSKLNLSSEARKRSLANRFPAATQRRRVFANDPNLSKAPLAGAEAKARISPLMMQAKTAQPTALPVMRTMMAGGTSAEDVRNARATLILGALTDSHVADGLGLAFTDTTATNGQQAQYVLSFVQASGAAVDVATADINVGSDVQPQAPEGLDATQIGVNHVALYWKPAPDALSQALILPSYRVVRVDAANPSGLVLSAHPVLKSSVAASDNPNEQVEPLFSYEDNTAPVGQVTYKVTMMDGFGRESATAASVAVNVEDWATPAAVTLVKTQLNADKLPQVLWTASASPDAKYRIYRMDVAKSQDPNYKPELVTPDLIDGNKILAETKGRPLRGLVAELQTKARISATQVVQSPASKILQSPTAKASSKVINALGLQPYQSFVDAAAPRDHFYRYVVTAAYARNQRDSEARLSAQIGVPYLTPPPTPTGLSGVFEPVHKVFKRAVRHMGRLFQLPPATTAVAPTGPIGVGPGPMINKVQTLKMTGPVQVRSKVLTGTKEQAASQVLPTAVSRTRAKIKLPSLPTPDYACYALLTWQPVLGPGAPFTYRVYRIPAPTPAPVGIKRYNKAIPLTATAKMFQSLGASSQATVAPSVRGGTITMGPTPALAGPTARSTTSAAKVNALGGLKSPIAAKTVQGEIAKQALGSSPLISSMVSEKARHYAINAALFNPPILVTETGQTTAKDGHMASPVGQDVDYIVVPKNQWGVEGEPAKVRVHLKPTMAPSVPTLISAMPNPDQPDQVLMTVIANPDPEEVTKYVVLRKPLPDPPRKTTNMRFKSRVSMSSLGVISRNSASATATKSPVISALTQQKTSVSPLTQRVPSPVVPQNNLKSQVYEVQDASRMSALLEALATFQPVPDASLTLMAEPGFVHVLDKSTLPDKHYAYRVIAVNSNNLQSGESGYLEAATRLGSLPAPTIGEAVVTADGVSIPIQGGVAGTLVLERAQTVGTTDTDFIQILGPVSGALMDRTVMKGQIYKYRVRQFSADGLGSPPSRVVTAHT